MKIQVVPVLGGLFLLTLLARGGEVMTSTREAHQEEKLPAESLNAAATFSELDVWEEELRDRAREIDAQAVQAELALAEAKRIDANRSSGMNKEAITSDRAKKLAAVYGAIDAELAAETLASLPIEKSALVVAEMAPDIAGSVLAAMPKATGKQIADYLLRDE